MTGAASNPPDFSLATTSACFAAGRPTTSWAVNVGLASGSNGAGNIGIDPRIDEVARNTDPGVGNVLASAGNYLIRGVTKVPTLVPDYPAVGNVRDTDTVNGAAGTLDSDKILKSNATGSGAGNWDDDNLGVGDEGNVADGVDFGLAQTGTLVAGGSGGSFTWVG
jgi:hypothetical protein